MLASADETKMTTGDVARTTGVPAWRIVLGNVAAGATAGCAVEAGKLFQTLLGLSKFPAHHPLQRMRLCHIAFNT